MDAPHVVEATAPPTPGRAPYTLWQPCLPAVYRLGATVIGLAVYSVLHH